MHTLTHTHSLSHTQTGLRMLDTARVDTFKYEIEGFEELKQGQVTKPEKKP